MAESNQLALDPSVAPARILAGHLQHEVPDRRCGGRSAWSSMREGPPAGDELGVPAQQGSGRHEPQPAQLRGQQSAQGAENRTVNPAQPWTWVVTSQDADLVTEHQDLDVFGCIGPGEQRQPAQHAASIRYASRKVVVDDHAGRAAGSDRGVGWL